VEEPQGATVVAPKPGAAEVSEEKRPRLFGVGVWRAVLVVAYLLLAWPLVLPDAATFPSDIPEGLALAALTLSVVAGISLGYRRWRWSRGDQLGHRPSYRVSFTSIPVVLVALVLALGAASNRAAQRQQNRQNLATSDAVSADPLNRDRGAYAAWMTTYPGAMKEEALALHNLRLVRAEVKRAHPAMVKLTSDFAAAHTHAQRFLAAIEAQPAATSAVHGVKALHVRAANTLVAATTDYVRGLHPVNQKLLNVGDTLVARFETDLRYAVHQGDALYHSLGGYSAFKNRIDWQAYGNQLLAVKKAAYP
jgi:hypothetical protein